MVSDKTIQIAGAGLAGSLLAILMAQRGFRIEMFEKRPDMRQGGPSAGRSINLAISTRGLTALAKAGLTDEVLALAIPMRGRQIHAVSEELSFQPYGKDDSECIHSISRGALNVLLMNAAVKTGRVQIQFDTAVQAVDLKERQLSLEHAGRTETRQFDVLLGADGAGSILREALAAVNPHFSCTVDNLRYGYKELTMPAAPRGGFLLEKNALHIWPRRSFMLIALPNLDQSFTCTLFLPYEGSESFARLREPADVDRFFHQFFPDALRRMPALAKDFMQNPTGHLATVRSFPWYWRDRALILGDAAHAVVPFYGQGMNCAFESATLFAAAYDRHGEQGWEEVFRRFTDQRKPDADAIADMALANFVEMRDLVGDPRFLLQKEVARLLALKYPREFVPQYSLVTFQTVPYSYALRCGRWQDEMLARLCRDIAKPEDVDWRLADELVRDYALKIS